jgi:hypothetical protein
MTKFFFFMLLTALATLDCQSLKNQAGSSASDSENSPIDLEKLGAELLGRWNYQFSSDGDKRFVIDDLGDLSRFYQFQSTNTDLIASEYPKFFQFAREKPLFGLESLHDSHHYGAVSYPLVLGTNHDSTQVAVGHFEPGDGIGITYSYFITHISKDTLVLVNERVYELGGRSFSGLGHVYLREK